MVITIKELIKSAMDISRFDTEVLLAHLLNCERTDFLLKGENEVSLKVQKAFQELVNKRKSGCPVAYLIGEKEFFSLPFYVDENCLIPRPDTEILVEWAIDKAKGKRVLDLCSGSGCIGVSVARFAGAKVTFMDISEKALEIAKKNAERNGVKADFVRLDILNDEIEGEYDIMLSNPPYIETEVIKTLDIDVCNFEPHLALDGGKDGLKFYPVIIEKASRVLPKNGYLAVEVGHKQSHVVAKMMENAGFLTEQIPDYSNILRVVAGKKQ